MPSSELECCLHGRVCRAGLKQVEEKEETEQYVNLMQSKGQKKKTRKEEAVERLAEHLIHVEEHAERRRRRREKRAKRRSHRKKEKVETDVQPVQGKAEDISSNDISTKSFKQVTESAKLGKELMSLLPSTAINQYLPGGGDIWESENRTKK
ncbi:hypothetical protein Y032_0017g3471 [Ancylostoma ceylanicum]|uniref:Uncharacterized protein n=1 Tax=Ancylostoma ceylanicum TaxID=53326 RepID=A0A016V5V3_9BILA|nr:hypothetical protein Y032_0017g3471 [Ancylostoma ceylanicum]